MSKIKNGWLDQYGAEHFEQQQFGTAGTEGVKLLYDQLAWLHQKEHPAENRRTCLAKARISRCKVK